MDVSRSVAGDGSEKRGDRISIQHRKIGLIVKGMEGDDTDLSIPGIKLCRKLSNQNHSPRP